MTAHVPVVFFRDLLALLGRSDPEDARTTAPIVATFAMASPAAPTPSPTHLLGQLTVPLVQLWQVHAPADQQAVLATLDLAALRRPRRTRSETERQQQLQTAVMAASQVVAARSPQLALLAETTRLSAQLLLAAIPTVIAEETSSDESGQLQERANHTKGFYPHMSALDLESTFRKHAGRAAVFGTTAVIATTARRMCACVALRGSRPDRQAPAALIRQLQAAEAPLPRQFVIDQAGGWGKTRAQLAALSDGQTHMVAWLPASAGSDPRRFSLADFASTREQTSCSCRNGVVTTRVEQHGTGDGLSLRFLACQCRDCPLWDPCRDRQAKAKGQRAVFISEYHAQRRSAAAFKQTPQGQARLKSRWQVEPTSAWLVRYHGCRVAGRVGLAAAQFQLFQAGALGNLLVWLSRPKQPAAR